MSRTTGAARGPRLTRRALLGGVAALAAGLASCGGDRPARWAGRYLAVATTGGALREALAGAVFAPFGRATGCTVQDRSLPARDLIRELRRQALVGRAQWDVVVLDAPHAALAARATPGLFATEEAPAFAVDSLTLAWRRGAASARMPASWGQVWSGEPPGARLWPADPVGLLEIALLADGATAEALYPLDLDRAFAALDRLRAGDLAWWERSADAGSALSLGRADLVLGYGGELRAAVDGGAAAALAALPSPLLPLTINLPQGSPNGDVAADFADYARGPAARAALGERGYGLGEGAPPNALVLDVGWWREGGGDALDRFERWLGAAH